MQPSETDLIRRAQLGDPEAFDALVRPHLDALYRIILPIARNHEDAQDALQEALIRAFRNLSSFRGASSFRTWLYRIAVNATSNWLRHQYRASAVRFADSSELHVPQPSPSPLQVVLRNESRQQVRTILLALPQHYRDAILLRYYSDMSYDEIAEILDIPLGTVKSRLAQALRLIGQRLQPNTR